MKLARQAIVIAALVLFANLAIVLAVAGSEVRTSTGEVIMLDSSDEGRCAYLVHDFEVNAGGNLVARVTLDVGCARRNGRELASMFAPQRDRGRHLSVVAVRVVDGEQVLLQTPQLRASSGGAN